MNIVKKILCLMLVFAGSFSFAQEDDSWVQGKIIVDVEFEGLKNIDINELNGIVSPYIGKEFSDDLFLELQTLMYELDYFEFIIPNAKPGDDTKQTVILVFNVQESPSISKILFEGNKSIWSNELFNTIVVKAKDIYSDFKVQNAQKKLEELYIDKGYSNVSIEVKKESDEEKNSVQLIFNINEGEQTLIREINFNGNNLFANDNKLRSLIATKKKTLFENGVYKEDVIQSDILTIEGYYHSNGYINAKVIDVKTTIEDDENKPQTKNMYIDFFIEEGDVYTYGGIKYNGNSIYTDAEFDKFEFMKFGDVYNKSSHEKRFIKIQSLYYDNGYIENSFHDQVDIDEENKIVSHVISIIERGVALVGDITVSGNAKTKDIVILREIQIKPGDVFSRQKVWESLSNIMSTGLFSNAVPQLNRSEDGNMDLVFQVEETSTLNLMGGITVSGANFEPALSFSLKDLNFLGMGRTFGGTLNLGIESQSFSLEYNEPRILGTEFFGGGSLSFTHEQSDILQLQGTDSTGAEFPKLTGVTDYAGYQEWLNKGNTISKDEEDLHSFDISFSISAGHLWYTNLGRVRASSGYTTSMESFFRNTEIIPFKTEYRKTPGEWEFSDRIWARGVLDNRDTPIGTSQGYGFSQNLTFGGLLPLYHTSDYIKSITNGDLYFKLLDTPVTEDWDFLLSLRLHAAYTRIFNKPGMTLAAIDRNARIDGMFVGRGWSPEGDGVALLDLKVEINAPIVPGMFGASLFFDGANIWKENEETTKFALDDFKFSFGLSLGITNQIMPISFYVAKTFRTNNGVVEWSPESSYNKIPGGFATWGIAINLNYLLQ